MVETMYLLNDLKALWGYSHSQAVELIERYKLLGELEDLKALSETKRSIVEKNLPY